MEKPIRNNSKYWKGVSGFNHALYEDDLENFIGYLESYQTKGVVEISKERKRQVEKEGWDSEHDDTHTDMSLSLAGASYILDVAYNHADIHQSWRKKYKEYSVDIFPFDEKWFKATPDNPIRQLVKSGALICAEIDRIYRSKPQIINN